MDDIPNILPEDGAQPTEEQEQLLEAIRPKPAAWPAPQEHPLLDRVEKAVNDLQSGTVETLLQRLLELVQEDHKMIHQLRGKVEELENQLHRLIHHPMTP